MVLRRVLGIGLAWAVLWAVFWAIVLVTIGIVDPDSIDPGEGPAAAAILGSMGLFSGVVFGMLLSIGGRARIDTEPLMSTIGWGVVSSAIVQLGYLGHGDQGLAANIWDALIFCALGGAVTAAWLALARTWSRRRSSLRSSS
jgi:hypothetical protein